jgi:hypothetical protein
MAVGCRQSVRLTAEAGAEEQKVLFVAEGSLKVRLVVGAVYDAETFPVGAISRAMSYGINSDLRRDLSRSGTAGRRQVTHLLRRDERP